MVRWLIKLIWVSCYVFMVIWLIVDETDLSKTQSRHFLFLPAAFRNRALVNQKWWVFAISLSWYCYLLLTLLLLFSLFWWLVRFLIFLVFTVVVVASSKAVGFGVLFHVVGSSLCNRVGVASVLNDCDVALLFCATTIRRWENYDLAVLPWVEFSDYRDNGGATKIGRGDPSSA